MQTDRIRAVVSAEANMNAANVKVGSEAIAGRSQNDFVCAAKIDALFAL